MGTDTRYLRTGRALSGIALGLVTAAVFELVTVLATQDKAIRAVSPWQDDPYDVAVSLTQFAVPVLVVMIGLRLLAWSEPGREARAGQLLRATAVLAGMVGLTAGAEWAAVAAGAHRAAWTSGSTLLIAGLVVVSVLDMAAAVVVVAALRSPAFVRVLLAGFVSDTGDWMLFVALPLVVYRLTGSALGTSVAFVLELVPIVLLAPVAARLVGRFDRRRLLVAVSLVQAAAVAPLLLVRTAEQIPVLYAVIVLQASCSAVFEPTKDSWMPELVSADRLVSANALIGLAQNVGRLVGGPLGGALLAFGRMDVIVAADIASFVLAAALLWTAPHDRRKRMNAAGGSAAQAPSAGTADHAGGASPTRVGVVPALRQRGLRATYVSAGFAAIAQGLFLVLFVLFVTDSLKGTDAEVGLLRGIQAVGSIAAGAALGLFAVAARPRRIAMIGAVAFGLISLAVWNLPAITTATWPYVVLFMLVGAPGVLLSTGYISLIQTAAADRGSAFAAYGLVSAVGQGVGLLAAGVAQPVTGLLPLLEAQGALYLLAGAVMLSRRGRSRTAAADVSAATARKRSAVESGGTRSTS